MSLKVEIIHIVFEKILLKNKKDYLIRITKKKYKYIYINK